MGNARSNGIYRQKEFDQAEKGFQGNGYLVAETALGVNLHPGVGLLPSGQVTPSTGEILARMGVTPN